MTVRKSPLQKLIDFDAMRVFVGKKAIFDQNKPRDINVTPTEKNELKAN